MSLVHPMEVPELRTEKSFTISDPVGYVTQIYQSPIFYRSSEEESLELLDSRMREVVGEFGWTQSVECGMYSARLHRLFNNEKSFLLVKDGKESYFITRRISLLIDGKEVLIALPMNVEALYHEDMVGVCYRSSLVYQDAFGKGISVSYLAGPYYFKTILTIDTIESLLGAYLEHPKIGEAFVLICTEVVLPSDVDVFSGVEKWDGINTFDCSFIDIKLRDGSKLCRISTPVITDLVGEMVYGKNCIEIEENNVFIKSYVSVSFLMKAVFPVRIDPDNYYATTDDYYVYGKSNSAEGLYYNSAGYVSCDISNPVRVGRRWSSPFWLWAYRGEMKFDTSSIPDSDNISQVNLYAAIKSDNSDTDFDVQIKKYSWSTLSQETDYDGIASSTLDAVWRNTSGISVDTYYGSPNLDTTRINVTGNTSYGLISSLESPIPLHEPTGDEYIGLYAAEDTYPMYLSITHVPTC